MRIAICDDDSSMREKLEIDIKYCFKTFKVKDIEIDLFETGDDLVESTSEYDMAFLDVEMPGISGINVGRHLYENNKNIILFIVTSFPEFMDEALKFHAFRFFQKPVQRHRLLINIKDALILYNQLHRKVIIEQKDNNIVIDTNDIIMIEAGERSTTVYTKGNIYYSIIPLAVYQRELDKYNNFIQTHRSFIVNLNYVKEYKKDLITFDNYEYKAKITKRKNNQFKAKLKAYLELQKE